MIRPRSLITLSLLLSSVFSAGAVKGISANLASKKVFEVERAGASKKALPKGLAVASSLLLAFNSGFSNGACLGGGVSSGAKKQAVSAVTGAWTTSAVGFASGDMGAFKSNAKCIGSYLSGSAIAGFLNPNPTTFQMGENVPATFFIGAALMYGASTLAGKDSSSLLPYLLALAANGLCNSVTSVHTANLCRTAHFSGITSDMGTFIGQILGGNNANLFKLKVFAGLAASFWVGGAVSYQVAQSMASSSLMVCAILYALTGLSSMLY